MTADEVAALIKAEQSEVASRRTGLPQASDLALAWPLKLSALVEEVGEVARALNDDAAPIRLQEELVQVAALACSWLESRPLILPGQEDLFG